MSIKSVLVAYSGDASGSGGLQLACMMALKYDAHLTGVVWRGPDLFEGRYPNLPRDIRDIIRRQETESLSEVRRGFDERIATAGLTDRSTFLDLGSGNEFRLADAARCYDIVVMGSRAAAIGRENFAARPDVVALRSGRPLILVPHGYAAAELPEHALVAWDGKRAAARALGDAMHILQTKSRVTVLSVGDAPPASHAPGDDILTLLRRHGIAAEMLTRKAGRGGVARTLLDTCAEVDAGLLVMGAYEHSKFSEDILGGVTRDIFDSTTLPVLMSH